MPRDRFLASNTSRPLLRRTRQGARRAIQCSVVNIHRMPDANSEVVNQALLGTPVIAYQEVNGWRRVRMSDYAGWTRSEALGLPTTTLRLARLAEHVAVVIAPRAALYDSATGGEPHEPLAALPDALPAPFEAYATVKLPLIAESEARVQVGLPGPHSAWLDRADVAIRPTKEPYPFLGAEVAVALAKQMLDVPYLWGGVSVRGFDCSGLAQVCCRHAGVIIPSDADEQYEAIPYIVERGGIIAGDLLFFARAGVITHVGIALDATHMLHANGYFERTTIDALDPADPEYTTNSERLNAMYAGARRPLTPAQRDLTLGRTVRGETTDEASTVNGTNEASDLTHTMNDQSTDAIPAIAEG